jgi:tetratricopeptide (TPR) repeat protein
MRPNRALLAGLALCLALPIQGEGKAAPPAKAPAAASPKAADVPSLAAARAELKSAKDGGPAFASRLSALSDALPPGEALELLDEFAPLVSEGATSKALLLRAGELALLLGRYEEAADSFEAAAFRLAPARDDALLLRSARERLAAGETDRAAERADLVLRSASEPSLARGARLVSAWAALVAGRSSDAKRLASAVLSGDGAVGAAPPGGNERREALFIEWAAALPGERPSALSSLAKEYPESPECALASGDSSSQDIAFLPLPHWYLSGLLGEVSGPRPAGLVASSAAATAAATAADDSSGGKALRYQLGVFSKSGNAALLVAELAKKGFQATIEERLVKGQRLEAVVVQAGSGDTLLKLKDAGYEAYPLF